jgi:type IV pilus assembly protein PilV
MATERSSERATHTPIWKCLQLRRRSDRGFALVEALVSILIFSFGVLGLIGLEARGVQFSVDAENRNRAALLSSEIASSMWLAGNVAQTPAQMTAWNFQASDANAPLTGLPSGVVTITQVGTTNVADITISWQAPSRSTTDQLTTRIILP